MLLHIGGDVSVPLEKLIMILNARRMQKVSADYIARARREHRMTACAGEVKSYILVRERGKEAVFASPISPATLEKRLRSEIGMTWLSEAAVYTVTEAE